MNSIVRYLVGIPVWAAALYGTLQLHSANLGLGHGICGKWGCGPPIEALLGWHGFSMLLVLPLAILIGLYLSDGPRHKFGSVLFWGALGAIAIYMIQDGIVFYQRANSTEHLVQRALFCIATAVDLPMLQVALAGLCLKLPIWNRPEQSMPVSDKEAVREPLPS